MQGTVRVPVFDILLVEDNEADVTLTNEAFRDATTRIQIHTVRDGEEALAFLSRTGVHADAPRPDLVLLDLSLPRVDGFQVLAQMKTDPHLKKIPVIVISGSDRDADKTRAYDLQISSYLVKPVELDRYFTAVRAIKEAWFHALSVPPKETDAPA